MRLALYLHSIQQTPNVSGESYPECISNLMGQFQKLPAEQRKEGKRLGRIRIRDGGGLDAVAGYLVPVPAKALRREIRLQKRREKASQWPPESPACFQCRVRGYDIPKRSWPSQEMADAVRLSLRDPLMVTYACPVQPGYFHVGHAKTRNYSTQVSIAFRRGLMNSDLSSAVRREWRIFPLLYRSRLAMGQPLLHHGLWMDDGCCQPLFAPPVITNRLVKEGFQH